MGELHIERAQEKDIPGMLALWKDTPGLGWGAGDDEESLAAFMQKNPQTCLVLKREIPYWVRFWAVSMAGEATSII